MEIKIKKLHPDAVIPKYQTEGAAGFDLHIVVDNLVTIKCGETVVIGTGLAFEIPQGYEMQVRLRSSIGKVGIIIPNGVGTIDADYRGEVHIIVTNVSGEVIQFKNGDRIAQGIINKIECVQITEVQELSETERGARGFGSTGGVL